MGPMAGRLTCTRSLGRGGFGEVYLVRVDGEPEALALKILRHDLRSDDAEQSADRLRDEARILGILKHPAIVRPRALVRVDHRLALLMEYARGLDLASLTTTWKPIPARVATEVVAQVADALDYGLRVQSPETMRALNLVHRDVKAENVVITPQGQVKLLDFGIARSGEIRRHAHTSTGSVTMTLRYAAPECLMGAKASAKSDIYALGAMLFRMIGGAHLFDEVPFARQVGLCAMAAMYDPWLEERLAGEALAPIRPLLEQMLAFEPDARPEARDVAARCAQYAALAGPTLAEWARGMEIETTDEGSGALVGRELEFEVIEVPDEGEDSLRRVFAEELAARPELSPPTAATEAEPRARSGWAELSLLAFIAIFGLAWLAALATGTITTVGLYVAWAH